MPRKSLFSLLFLVVGLSLWTLAPYGGCACNNPLGPDGGPQPTPTPTHGPLIDDFDNGSTDPVTHKTYWHGSLEKSVDTFGTSTHSLVIGPPGYNGNAMFYSGVFGSPGTAPPYPFNAERIYITSSNSGSENVLAYGSNGLRFYAKRGTAVNSLVVKVIIKSLYDYTSANTTAFNAYHFHSKTQVLTTGWVQQVIPYSQFAWGGSWGADSIGPTYNNSNLSQPVCRPGGELQVVAIQFEPANPTTFPNSAAFDFAIDNLEFY